MKLKELFTDESKWTQGAMAKTSEGRPVHSHHPDAVSWSFFGGYLKCYKGMMPGLELEGKIKEKIGGYSSIISWEQQATFEQVKALCEELDI